MTDYLCHDIKTPRTDTSKRLPNTFKLVPALFYLALVAGAYFMTMDWLAYKRAQREKLQADIVRQEHTDVIANMQAEKASLDKETGKAQYVAKWVEGSRNVQPLGVAIARAIPPEVRISDLTLERSDQVPANLSFSVRINGGSAAEVGMIEATLSRLQYRSLSPQQSKDGDVIEYRSTLVRQE
jgi:hypothetical protein